MIKRYSSAILGAVVSLAVSGPVFAATLDFEGFTFSSGFTAPIGSTYTASQGVTFDAGSNVLRSDGGTNFTPVNTGARNEVAAYLDSGPRLAFFVQGGFTNLAFDYASNSAAAVSVYDQNWTLVSAGSSVIEAVVQNCNPSVHFSCWASASFGYSSTAYYAVVEGTTQELIIDNLMLEVVNTNASALANPFALAPWNSSSSAQTVPSTETTVPGPSQPRLPVSSDVPLPGSLPLVGLGFAMVGRVRRRNGR
jgi:hypothetical protein